METICTSEFSVEMFARSVITITYKVFLNEHQWFGEAMDHIAIIRTYDEHAPMLEMVDGVMISPFQTRQLLDLMERLSKMHAENKTREFSAKSVAGVK